MKEKVNSIMKFIKRNKALTRTLCFALSLIMIFYVIPSTVFSKASELLDHEATKNETAQATDSITALTVDPFEIIELREEYAKHFRLSDGSYVAAQYKYPVHSLDENGEWQDIDNALSKSSSEFTNANARIKFAKKINGSATLFTLHDGNTKITLNLIGAEKGTKGTVTNGSDTDGDTELQKMINLEKLSASILYEDILDGVDLEYVAYSMNVKENIIVKERKDTYSYSFELKLNGLTPQLTTNGDIELVNDESDEIKYVIPAPIVFDANGIYAPSNAASYTLTHENEKKYILTVTADTTWMNADDRAFPITIDPAVTVSGSGVIDTYVDIENLDFSGNSETILYVTDKKYSYWRSTTLPTIPNSAIITDATIGIHTTSNTINGSYVGVHEVYTFWDPTHSERIHAEYGDGSFEQVPSDYLAVSNENSYNFDITKTVKKWYSGELYNHGVVFKAISGHSAYVEFYSNESSENKPVLTINYKDMKGLESYWTYSSHSVGTAGNGNVNLANGNLVFTIPTLTATDSIFAYTPYLTYDSSLAGKYYTSDNANIATLYHFLGTGFKISTNETIAMYWYNNTEFYYVYSDADGTEHYFYPVYNELTNETFYIDEDGLGLTLAKDNSGNIIIRNEADEIKFFEKLSHADYGTSWRLKHIEDINGNQLIYSYENVYYPIFRPVKISLLPNGKTESIDLLEFRYHTSTGNLIMVYNHAAEIAVVMRYSNSYNSQISASGYKLLRQIDYAAGSSSVTADDWYNFALNQTTNNNITVYESAQYNYDSSERLTSVVNMSTDHSIRYTWNGNSVAKISEYAENELGQELEIEYDVSFAQVRQSGNDEVIGTEDDILTRYTFDNYGRVISMYSCSYDGTEIYGGATGIYDTQTESKNSLTERVVVGEVRANLLLNGDFRTTSKSAHTISYWTLSGNVVKESGNNISSPDSLFLKMSPDVGTAATISQTVTLAEGEYTFSMACETLLCTNVEGWVEIIDTAGNTVIHSESVIVNQGSTETRRVLSTDFELSESKNITVKIYFAAVGTLNSDAQIHVGKAKLERGVGFSDFNLIDAGDFNNTGAVWIANNGNISVDSTSADQNAIMVLNANMGQSYATQTLLNRSATELTEYEFYEPIENTELQFTLAGYAKADNPIRGKEFRIYVDVTYYYGQNNDITVRYPVDFATICEQWQYAVGTFALDKYANGDDLPVYKCIKSVKVGCEYSNQASGSAYFDNISLVFTGLDNAQKYSYKNGKTVRVIDGTDQTFYVYNSNGNVERVADNKGNLTIYHYSQDNPNLIDHEIEYSYTYKGATRYYPYNLEEHDTLVTKTAKKRTDYTYNSFGMLTEVHTQDTDESGNILSTGSYVIERYVYEVSDGSKIFGALTAEYNANGEHLYFYDQNTGWMLATVQTKNNSGIGYAYSYDAIGRLVKVESICYYNGSYSSDSNSPTVEYEYDETNRLSAITTDSTTYVFVYDQFGNSESVNVGAQQLAEYEYNDHNGKLKRIIYGNGYEVEYVYNDMEQLETVKYRNNANEAYVIAYEYEYTADGQIYLLKDNVNNRVLIYRYDECDRVVSFTEYSADDYESITSKETTYNSKSQVSSTVNRLSYSYTDVDGNVVNVTDNIIRNYTYLYDGRLNSYNTSGNFSVNVSYSYDSLDRITEVLYNNGGVTLKSKYTYVNNPNYGESARVYRYTGTVNSTSTTYTYTYDSYGNITKILYGDGQVIEYTYNIYGMLVTENNDLTSKYYQYVYDNAGNLIQVKSKLQGSDSSGPLLPYSTGGEAVTFAKPFLPTTITNNYGYTNSEWGDLLTSYNGVTITYDEIGNPLSYYNGSSYTFTWQGRQLMSAVKGSNTMSFEYNDAGLRISKTVNGVTTHYVYDGSLLLAEYNDTTTTVYIYDALGSPIGFKSRANSYAADTWDVYWYDKNLQGDIVAIYNSNGTKLVSYTYNAWGVTSKTYSNGGASTTAANNNLTYRGYYYDSNLGMYYLQSRYYDPAICRFINADCPDVITATPDALTDKNLYAYCDNNPVMRVDEDGEFWLSAILIGAAIGAVVSGITSIITQKIETGTVNLAEVAISSIAGALSGALATTGIGALGSGIINAAIDGIEYMSIQTIRGEEIDDIQLFTTMFISSVTAGKGMNTKRLRAVYKHSDTVLKTAVSSTKKMMYTAKKVEVTKTVVKRIGDTVGSGLFSVLETVFETKVKWW